MSNLHIDDLRDLLTFAKNYARLGSAVQEQLHDLLEQGVNADINSNAVEMIKERLWPLPDAIREACDAYLEGNEEFTGSGFRYASTGGALRAKLIRLAAANPELRADLLPLLKEDADPASVDQNKPESYYGLPPKGIQASTRRRA